MTRPHSAHNAFLALAGFLALALASLVPVATVAAAAQPTSDAGKATLGKDLFRSYCTSCHGQEARGNGPLAEVLTVPPSDLTLLAAGNDGTFPDERTRQVIDGRTKVRGHGTADMPAWGDAFKAVSTSKETSEDEVNQKIDQLVHYLKTIQQ